MKTKNIRILVLAFCLLIGLSASGYAALLDRGNGLIYDDDLNITWLADANYAVTSGFDADGKMSWDEAIDWADSVIYEGFDDWRLTTTLQPDPTCSIQKTSANGIEISMGGGCTGGELGHLFYEELGLKIGDSILSSTDPALAFFTSIQAEPYWSETLFAPDPENAWSFHLWSGFLSSGKKTGNVFFWLVRDGDVLPASSGYSFTDATEEAGVANGDHIHWGVTSRDYDSDGLLDIYVVNDSENTLYRNNGDGTFTDATVETGTGDPFAAMDNVFGDYDNDGDQDLYSHNFTQSTLYQNNGNVFSDVNVLSGAGVSMRNGTGAAWADYDNDGFLDLHLNGFPGENVLLHNNGDGTFTDLRESAGLPLFASAMGNAWNDYNRDGLIDLAVSAVTPQDTSFLYRNNGDGTFTDVTLEAGIILDPGSSTAAVAWGDYDNDGWFDFVLTEVLVGSQKVVPLRIYLFRNKRDGTFEEVSAVAGLTSPPEAIEFWETGFADYDNDGDLDLYIGVDGPNLFFRNNGDGTFTDIAPELGLDRADEGKGLSWGDYDNDGDLDLYLLQRNRAGQDLIPNILFRNEGGTNNWLQVALIGTISNRDGIGAKIVVSDGFKRQIREVNGGTGLFSQHTPIQQFGLGNVELIRSVRIVWPSGVIQILTDVAVNQRLVVTEP